MTADEIREEIKRVERAIFYEQMADFMDWDAYYSLTHKLENLRLELEKIEG